MTFKFDAPEVAGVSARVMTPAAMNVRAHAYLRVLNRLAERYTLADVTDHSPFAPYLTFDPSRGDMGLILEDERQLRSEERRVGKECRSRWSPYH